jgi:hypothetical protein
MSVQVTVEAPITYSDIAPILDELGQQFRVVKTTRIDARGLAVGGPGTQTALSILIDIGEFAGALVIKDLLSELTKDTYRELRDEILEFRRRKQEEDGRPGQPSVSFTIGGLWFRILAPVTGEELVDALIAAYNLAEGLPEEEVVNPLGAARHYDWDAATRTWTGPHLP